MGGGIAKRARHELEQKTGRNVVTGENFLPPAHQKPKLKKVVAPLPDLPSKKTAQRLR